MIEFGRYWVQHPKWGKAYLGTVIPQTDTVVLDVNTKRDEYNRQTVVVHRLSKHVEQGTRFIPLFHDEDIEG